MNSFDTYDRIIAVGIDMQNDFCPGGSLAVDDGDKAVDSFNMLASWVRKNGGEVLFTRDWHPAETSHFGNPPDFVNTWPVHCVQDTLGAAFNLRLDIRDEDKIISKGMEPGEDSYSGFEGVADDGSTLRELIVPRSNERVAVFLGGLATDYCVKATVMGALMVSKEFKSLDVFAVTDAMRGVTQDGSDEALETMSANGARLVTVAEIVTDKEKEA